jgi:mannitol-1-/sugar-/sorbitol-6-phosphatase
MTEFFCDALLFDMDGVLIDSTKAVARVWNQWAMERGFDPESTVKRAHGRPSLATVREYLPHADHDAENREVERREMADLDGVVALPGALELLSSLPPHRWTIATSCTRPLADVRLRAAGLPIPANIVTSNDVEKGKPDPEPYLKAAAILGYDPSKCVVVEDAPAGIRSGRSSGARVIGLTTVVRLHELREAGADWVVPDCAGICLKKADSGLALILET